MIRLFIFLFFILLLLAGIVYIVLAYQKKDWSAMNYSKIFGLLFILYALTTTLVHSF